MKRVCVFAGSSSGVGPAYLTAAAELGRVLATRGVGLVYGGARVGLMGAVADAVLADGGRATGVIPKALVEKEVAHNGLTDLRVVTSMHERKALMADLSDGFIALPGGWGTLDEMFEILTWAQLGLHRKPFGLFNVQGYFDRLLSFLDHTVEQGFVRREYGALLSVSDTPGTLLDAMATQTPPAVEKWIDMASTQMSQATVIKAILFDIGGVLIRLDGVPSLAKLLGVEPSHETLHRLWMTSASVVAHETGRIGAAQFAAGVVADLGLPITPDAFLDDFCGWPGGLQPGAMELLEAIPGRYRVAALSNTSAVHWEKIAATGLTRRFERAFLSHEMGYLKPSPDAFLYALEGLDLPASDVLFIDDGRRNVEAAASLGMHARLACDALEARSVLVACGVL